MGMARAQGTVTLPVDAPAAHFSPGNWVGDTGRGGSRDRRSWTNGAYCTWTWSDTSAAPTATLLVTDPTEGAAVSYFLDGHLTDNVPVPATGGIPLSGLSGAGTHALIVYLRNSPQAQRWDGTNALKISGLTLDAGATPGKASAARPWVLIVGDSITEGIQADNGADDNLDDYSFLIGQALHQRGFDYGLSACGYSGWLRPGDATQDVPPYYSISGSKNGVGGTYDDAHSRWNKLDSQTSLLDSRGHLSAYGQTRQEPAAILINYGTNEALSHSDLSDTQASVTQSLTALRRAAPDAWLCVFVPFGLENTILYPDGAAYRQALQAGLAGYRAGHPSDRNITLVDLGPSVANALASNPYGGGVHPHVAGHAYIAAQVIPIVLAHLRPSAAH
jgi:lysophospholipase L1-like esterase